MAQVPNCITVHTVKCGEPFTTCCGRNPFDLPRTDQLTKDEPQPDPYEELVERLAEAGLDAHRTVVGWSDISKSERDDWKLTAKAILAELRTSCELGVVNETGGGMVCLLVDRDLKNYPANGTLVYLLPKEPEQ